MSDAADLACIHIVRGLECDDAGDLTWQCMDCGRVFASLAVRLAQRRDQLETWAARNGVPPRTLARAIARFALAPLEVR